MTRRDALIELRDKVKPLVWYDSPDDDTDFCADALGLAYVVDCDLDGLCSWGFFRHVGREGYDESWTIDDAKAAAQADYEARILSALSPTPSPDAVVRAAWKHAAFIARLYPAPHGNRIAAALEEDMADPEARAAIIEAAKRVE
jgi:hypothetical protein